MSQDIHPVIVASGNKGKLREITEILSGLPFSLTSLRDHWDPLPEIPETGSTFTENARIKSRWVFEKKGIWSLADDSGLEVDFLNGEPGVRSARYAGENASDNDRIAKLLSALKECPAEKRTARFRCAMVITLSQTEEISVLGTCEGTIGYAPSGTNGFGYDPLFTPAGFDATFAQLDSTVKNGISHRGNALAALRKALYERFGNGISKK